MQSLNETKKQKRLFQEAMLVPFLSLTHTHTHTLLPAVLYLAPVSVPYLTAWMCIGWECRKPPLLGDEAFRGGVWWRRPGPWW